MLLQPSVGAFGNTVVYIAWGHSYSSLQDSFKTPGCVPCPDHSLAGDSPAKRKPREPTTTSADGGSLQIAPFSPKATPRRLRRPARRVELQLRLRHNRIWANFAMSVKPQDVPQILA
jgi:hypothetical protein